MKSVMISIQPKWCELIASGEKTVEVRKTRPKIETAFKCYIYCTKGNPLMKTAANTCFIDNTYIEGQNLYGLYELVNGKVIGEFVCDDITKIINGGCVFIAEGRSNCELQTMARGSCLDFVDMKKYFGDKDGYGWHISDLVIYDEPLSIGEFCKPCDPDPQCDCEYCKAHGRSPTMTIKRVPQSWCYVEERK